MAARKPSYVVVGHEEGVGDLAGRGRRHDLHLLRIGEIIGQVAAGEVDDEAAMPGDRSGRSTRSRGAGLQGVHALPPGCIAPIADTARMR